MSRTPFAFIQATGADLISCSNQSYRMRMSADNFMQSPESPAFREDVLFSALQDTLYPTHANSSLE